MVSKQKENFLRAGPGNRESRTSSLEEVCPIGYGGGNSATLGETVGQEFETVDDTGNFKRRSSIKRTPPHRNRSQGQEDLFHIPKQDALEWDSSFDIDTTVENKEDTPDSMPKKKRKWEINTKNNKTTDTTQTRQIEKTLKNMETYMKQLNNFIKDNKNVHVPIKTLVGKISGMLNQAIKEENKPNKNNEEVTNEDMVALRDEIEELKKENNKLKQHLINIEKNLGQPGNEYLTNINGDNNYETYDKIVNKRWSNIIYKNTEIKIGNPVQTKDNVTKVVIVDTEDKKMEKSIQRTYRERFPELLEATGKFEVLEQKTTIRSHKDKGANVRKLIKIEYDGTEKDLYDRIKDIREETRGDEWIAMHTINKISTERLRKMIELIFTGTETNVVIYTNKDETNSTESNKEKKSYALVIEQAGTG
ncbi:uncharacterized protein [Euwallacea fornicatus]|uniref:uncharacterized protein n=1 Tax=Euwallacea fornicatus TaxID=995702 RepID=UPI00338FABE0